MSNEKKSFIRKMRKEEKSTRQIQKEYDVMININVFKAIKTILQGRREIQSAVELNVGGLKVRLTDLEKVNELIDNEIENLQKFADNEPSTYDPIK